MPVQLEEADFHQLEEEHQPASRSKLVESSAAFSWTHPIPAAPQFLPTAQKKETSCDLTSNLQHNSTYMICNCSLFKQCSSFDNWCIGFKTYDFPQDIDLWLDWFVFVHRVFVPFIYWIFVTYNFLLNIDIQITQLATFQSNCHLSFPDNYCYLFWLSKVSNAIMILHSGSCVEKIMVCMHLKKSSCIKPVW